MGNKLIKSRLTTGFQIEDYNPRENKTKKILYAHDNPKHLKQVQNEVGGKAYPRESYYKWNKSWKTGPNTDIVDKNLARGKEKYIQTGDVDKASRFFRNKTLKGKKESIRGSWMVPDIRIFNVRKPIKNFRNAHLVSKKIDRNSRMVTVVTKKKRLNSIKKQLVGEKVKNVKVQDFRPKKHSFFQFIKSR